MSEHLQVGETDPSTHGDARCFGKAGPFLVSRTRHRAGLSVGPHEHAAASLNFVMQGAYGETFRTELQHHPADTLLFRPACAIHANRFEVSGAQCLLLEIDAEDLRSIVGADASRTPYVSRDPRLSVLAVRILGEAGLGDDASAMIVEELSTTLLRSIAGAQEVTIGSKARRAEELLRSTYREPWSLSRVARAVDVHPAHLGRSFRARLGCTVGEFVRNLRVLHVAAALRDSDTPIAMIAIEAGFADQSHCTRVFQKLVGVSPGRFRARGREA